MIGHIQGKYKEYIYFNIYIYIYHHVVVKEKFVMIIVFTLHQLEGTQKGFQIK
jgi:hypothetical protein